MDNLSDEELFTKVQKGSKESMEIIVKRYYKNIFRYIYMKIGEYHTGEDLCQEVFCKVYNKRKTYSSKYPVKVWIYKIAHNIIVDYFRSKKAKEKKNTVELKYDMEEKNNIIEIELFKNNIEDLTEGLNENQKEVVNLRFKDQLTLEEIASVTNSSKNTVKTRLYSGIKYIKNKLKKRKEDYLENERIE